MHKSSIYIKKFSFVDSEEMLFIAQFHNSLAKSKASLISTKSLDSSVLIFWSKDLILDWVEACENKHNIIYD